MDNVIIDKPDRLEDDIEEFKIDSCEDNKNFIAVPLKIGLSEIQHQRHLFPP